MQVENIQNMTKKTIRKTSTIYGRNVTEYTCVDFLFYIYMYNLEIGLMFEKKTFLFFLDCKLYTSILNFVQLPPPPPPTPRFLDRTERYVKYNFILLNGKTKTRLAFD